MTDTLSPSQNLEQAHALAAQGRLQEALALLNSLRLQSPAPAVFIKMAEIFGQLGVHAGAQQVLREAAEKFPGDEDVLEALGNHYYRQDACTEGLKQLAPFLGTSPSVRLLRLKANLLKGAGRFTEAERSYVSLLEKNPQDGTVLSNLAGLYADTGRTAAALPYYERALVATHEHPHVRAQLAQLLLRNGRLGEGWRHHAARFESYDHLPASVQPRPFPQKKWDGKPVSGPLLLWGEQGIGEEILFASLIEEMKTKTPELLVECDARLVPLFSRSFHGVQFFARSTPPALALMEPRLSAQCAGGEAAAFLRPAIAAFGNGRAYLKADDTQMAACGARYEQIKRQRDLGGKIIGLSWRSKPLRQGDPKSTRLAAWAPVLEHAPHLFINLQHGDAREELDEAAARGWNIYTDSDISQATSLDAFAAQVAACDAVVSVSNTTAHMAGALGVQTAVLLPRLRGLMWHWFEEGERSPWYASARLLRQTQDGVWDDVLMRVAGFIRSL